MRAPGPMGGGTPDPLGLRRAVREDSRPVVVIGHPGEGVFTGPPATWTFLSSREFPSPDNPIGVAPVFVSRARIDDNSRPRGEGPGKSRGKW